MKTIARILLWIWQLPQNLVGLAMRLCMGGLLRQRYGGVTYWYKKGFPGGVTLGEHIFVGTKAKRTVMHEHGHVRQSRMLGPLYLLVIGLPSLIWAWLYGTLIKTSPNGYYKFYTERWADRLGGVER